MQRRLSHSNTYRAVFAALLIVSAVICGVMVRPAESKNDATASAPPVLIKTADAVRKDMPIELRAIGTVVPLQSVEVRARVSSQIVQVKFKDGDTVKAGDVLFILDDRTFKAQAKLAAANVARDAAQTQNLRKNFERSQSLIKQDAISKQSYDDSKTSLDAGLATLEADKAALDDINAQLTYTVITAPISGRTGTINYTLGNNVTTNDTLPLVTINQVQPIRVQISLPQSNFDALRAALVNGKVLVSAQRDTSDAVSTGEIAYIDNAISQANGTFVSRAVFQNENETLWPGMLANITVQIGQDKNAVVVPEQSVQQSPQGTFVFIEENGAAKQVTVKVARTQKGETVIAQGLQGNEKIITDGIMSLKNGSKVTTSLPKSQPAAAKDTK